jgi:hypothetical protein
MISISVDEAYAFDYLSILSIKRNINSDCYDHWFDCYSYIENQLGKNKMIEIVNSIEYIDLIKANQLTFDAVEKARYGSITAKEVDQANMLRYDKKNQLQQKFFSKDIKEIKT